MALAREASREEESSHHDVPPEDEEYLQAMVEQAVSLEESSSHEREPPEYDDEHVPALVVVPIVEAPGNEEQGVALEDNSIHEPEDHGNVQALEVAPVVVAPVNAEQAALEDNSIHEPEDNGNVQALEVAPVVVAPGNAAINRNEPEAVEAVYIAPMGRSTNKRKKNQKYPNGTRITMHFNDDDDDGYPYYLGFEGEHKDGIIVGYDNFNSCDCDMGICQQWTYMVRFDDHHTNNKSKAL